MVSSILPKNKLENSNFRSFSGGIENTKIFVWNYLTFIYACIRIIGYIGRAWGYTNQWTFYSATLILKKCRKVVLKKWFFKLGSFFLVNHFSQTRKNVDLWHKTIFFSGQPLFSNQISWTRFLEPYFSIHFSSPF